MPKKPKAVELCQSEEITRTLRRGRRDVRRELLRGITTWLVMVAERHQRAIRAITDERPNPTDEQTERYIRYNANVVGCIEYLARILPEGFGWKEWSDAENTIILALMPDVIATEQPAPPAPVAPAK